MGNADIVGDLQRLIVFDLDGTLVDSRRDLADSANELISELGGARLPVDAVARMVGEGAAVLVRRALAASGLSDDGLALQRFLQIYDTRLLRHTTVYDGMAEAVRFARSFGAVAVLTNKPLAPSLTILKALGMRDLFDSVVGGDGPLPRKPDPSALRQLIHERNAIPETTLLVGDSAIDHETATRAEVRVCLVSFGFGYDTFPNERLRGDEWVVDSPDELVQVLARFEEKTRRYLVRANGSSYER